MTPTIKPAIGTNIAHRAQEGASRIRKALFRGRGAEIQPAARPVGLPAPAQNPPITNTATTTIRSKALSELPRNLRGIDFRGGKGDHPTFENAAKSLEELMVKAMHTIKLIPAAVFNGDQNALAFAICKGISNYFELDEVLPLPELRARGLYWDGFFNEYNSLTETVCKEVIRDNIWPSAKRDALEPARDAKIPWIGDVKKAERIFKAVKEGLEVMCRQLRLDPPSPKIFFQHNHLAETVCAGLGDVHNAKELQHIREFEQHVSFREKDLDTYNIFTRAIFMRLYPKVEWPDPEFPPKPFTSSQRR